MNPQTHGSEGVRPPFIPFLDCPRPGIAPRVVRVAVSKAAPSQDVLIAVAARGDERTLLALAAFQRRAIVAERCRETLAWVRTRTR